MSYWCAAQTHSRAEDKARHHLLRQGFSVLLPKHLKRRSHARKIECVPRPLFPGYLFVRIDPETTPWRAILSTIGVLDLIRFGDAPASVPDDVIDAIAARQDDAGYVKTSEGRHFHPGERVRVLRGALGEFDALFESADDRDRVTVLLNLLGRQVRTTVPNDLVFAAL